MSRVGIVMGMAATVMFGTALVTFMTSSLRGPPFARLMTSIVSGAAGRILFHLAGWRLPVATAAVAASLGPERGRGPEAVLDTLEPAVRRGLRDVAAGIAKLTEESDALDTRVAQLELALQESRTGVTPGTETAGEELRSTFVAEAEAALAATRQRRQSIAAGFRARAPAGAATQGWAWYDR